MKTPHLLLLLLLLLLQLLLQLASADTTLRIYSDGSGDFVSVQAALDSLTPSAAGHVTLILQGLFRERVSISANFTSGVDLLGRLSSSGQRPLLIYNTSGTGGEPCSGAPGNGTFESATLFIYADAVLLANLDVANDACSYDHKAAGQSVALMNHADKLALLSVSLYGAQDTLYTSDHGRMYAADLWINGTCDAIFGGTAVFERASIHMNFTVTAGKGSPDGSSAMLFLNSSVDSLSGREVLLLGRPWGATAKVVWKNTQMGAGVSALGWDDWSVNKEGLRLWEALTLRCLSHPSLFLPFAHTHISLFLRSHGCTKQHTTWCNQTFFAEFNSTGPGAVPGARPWWTHQLTAEQAAQWTRESVLGDWAPPLQPPPLPPGL